MKKKARRMNMRTNRSAHEREKLTKSTPTDVPLVRARRVNGRWMGAEVKFDRDDIVEAIRRDRI